MEILLTSVAEAWRKKHTPKDTNLHLADSTSNHIAHDIEPTNIPCNSITDIEPPQAGNNGNNNSRQRHHDRLISIGDWPLGTSTGMSTENVDMMEPRAIVRTGSSISREEREVETCHLEQRTNTSGSIPLSQEVQRLEWFRLLVVLLVLLNCEVIMYVLVAQVYGNLAIVDLWDVLLRSFLTIGFYATGYVWFFIVLTEKHSAMRAFLDRLFNLRRLRLLARVYAFLVLARIGLIFAGFYFYSMWFL